MGMVDPGDFSTASIRSLESCVVNSGLSIPYINFSFEIIYYSIYSYSSGSIKKNLLILPIPPNSSVTLEYLTGISVDKVQSIAYKASG